jgi:ribose/xylose/arabinose/galactoside ABC-type transport system permease subunit
MGFLNGYLVMKLRITPVIATLVTLSLFKGIAMLIVPDGLSAIKSRRIDHAALDQRLRAQGSTISGCLGVLGGGAS